MKSDSALELLDQGALRRFLFLLYHKINPNTSTQWEKYTNLHIKMLMP
jgi:hypothetical protein